MAPDTPTGDGDFTEGEFQGLEQLVTTQEARKPGIVFEVMKSVYLAGEIPTPADDSALRRSVAKAAPRTSEEALMATRVFRRRDFLRRILEELRRESAQS